MSQILKGIPGQPRLQGGAGLQLTATDERTVVWQVDPNGIPSAGTAETGLTAHAGGGQASALALSATNPVHVVATVGSAADSVALPASAGLGAVHIVRNAAASNSMQLFGTGSDTVNGAAAATGIAVAAGKTAYCVDFGAGTWLAIIG